mgnify:CR=1 FL=1
MILSTNPRLPARSELRKRETSGLPSKYERIRSMAWKLLLPVELRRPLLYARDHIANGADRERRNLGTQYRIAVPSARSSTMRHDAPAKKSKHFVSPRMIVVSPHVYLPSGESRTALNAAAPMEVFRRTPYQPGWWYVGMERLLGNVDKEW